MFLELHIFALRARQKYSLLVVPYTCVTLF